MQPPRPPSSARWGATSVGIDPAIGAGLCYIVPILGLIFFFVEKTNRFLRFNGAQAFLTQLAAFIIWMPFYIFSLVTAPTYRYDTVTGSFVSSGGFFAAGCVACLAWLLVLAIGVLNIVALINAFQGKYFKIPVVGDIAENMAGGPPQPLF